VGEEYNLNAETLYLAVNYVDRFLSFMSVQRSKLQLVGTACMFIAAKYEEIYPPDVGEFVYITDDTYNKKQVLRMEHLVLKVIQTLTSKKCSILHKIMKEKSYAALHTMIKCPLITSGTIWDLFKKLLVKYMSIF